MTETTDLVLLAAALSNAKQAETEAKAARIAAEDALVAATGFAKTEGQESYDDDNEHGRCKLVCKQPITTKVDDDAWVALRRTLPPKHPARSIFKASYSLDLKKARKLQEADKAAWATVSDVITRKPGKISVELKELTIKLPAIDPTKKLGELGATKVNTGGDS